MRELLRLTLLLFAVFTCVSSLNAEEDSSLNLEDLKSQIEDVVEKKRLPSVSFALVNSEGVQIQESIGWENIAEEKPATPDSLYRIGSTSKMFVALSVLQLVEEGRLSLNDSVRKLIPEIKYTNKWEETNPLKLVHLLEHTTGWDDMHFVEYAHSQEAPIPLLDALNFHPHSRESRWVPGTRMAYCNTGPAVAAYIVEKITGERFEDYVEENLFKPLGMSSATYFLNEDYKEKGAILYNAKMVPESYWHILYRPSGSINASIRDMTQFLKLFVGRGSFEGKKIISSDSLLRMERPGAHLGAFEGLELGYGLHNYSSNFESWHFREHNGAVNHGLSSFAYLPEANAGYAVLLNSGDVFAQKEIEKIIRKYIVRNLTSPVVEKERELSAAQREWAGHYVSINPRVKLSEALTQVVSVFKVDFVEDKMRIRPFFGGWTAHHYPVSETLFKSDYTGAMHVALVEDPLVGRVLHMENTVLKPVLGFWVYLRLAIAIFWGIFVFSSIVYFLIWLVLRAKHHPVTELSLGLHLMPLFASLSAIIFFLLVVLALHSTMSALGSLSFYSLGLMLTSIFFFIFSLAASVFVIREIRSGLSRMLYLYFAIAAFLHLAVALYLLRFGLIGLMTWS